jgi:hypothetical protein
VKRDLSDALALAEDSQDAFAGDSGDVFDIEGDEPR